MHCFKRFLSFFRFIPVHCKRGVRLPCIIFMRAQITDKFTDTWRDADVGNQLAKELEKTLAQSMTAIRRHLISRLTILTSCLYLNFFGKIQPLID